MQGDHFGSHTASDVDESLEWTRRDQMGQE